MIKVLLVDDHELVRTGFKHILAEASDIEVVAEAATGEDALQQIAFASIRSDDMFKLLGEVWSQPAALELHGSADIAAAIALIAVSLVVSVLLALGTYALGARFARLVLGPTPAATRSKGDV